MFDDTDIGALGECYSEILEDTFVDSGDECVIITVELLSQLVGAIMDMHETLKEYHE